MCTCGCRGVVQAGKERPAWLNETALHFHMLASSQAIYDTWLTPPALPLSPTLRTSRFLLPWRKAQ